ncbi:MAG: hypothetical protein UR64_C0026G0007 [Candidatus Nomurabacteria bacterium GW2011_GWE1_35_16]|uniref:Uncharacterized protein n=1 Tax=Candidatus Nomurabacteria bacterium GW2011_GWE1_35_16 TaxID=1618761 RepID=A0A0G0B821_9BACT|nr:MAG: hypothetical protein UR64_C0026G0007 [Candidatus Nomurabacteria bacterium GW2011_GWE1_35_16]
MAIGEDTFGSAAENDTVIFAGVRIETNTERKGLISKGYRGTMIDEPEQQVSIEVFDIPSTAYESAGYLSEAFRIATTYRSSGAATYGEEGGRRYSYFNMDPRGEVIAPLSKEQILEAFKEPVFQLSDEEVSTIMGRLES